MSPRIAAIAIALLAAIAAPAQADVCTIDRKPSATLLVPYFEVDLASTTGATTIVTVRNTATRPKLANVVLWTRWNVPGIAFNVYLPAMASQRIDLGSLLRQGALPVTGPARGPVSEFDTAATPLAFPACNNGVALSNTGPGYPPLDAASLLELQARFSGVPTPGTGACFSPRQSDSLARGYVTIDSVNLCSGQSYPDSPGYFVDGGLGIANNENVLVGSFELVDAENNFADAAPAIGLEADSNRFFPGDETFYGRYSAFTATDDREPLPAAWAFDFDAQVETDSAELLVWRAAPKQAPRSCNGNPNWFPLSSLEQTPFNRDGDTPAEPFFPSFATPIGLASQRIEARLINDSLVPPQVVAGSARLNFYVASPGQPLPSGQSWVGVLRRSDGRFSELTPAHALGSSCAAGETVPANVSGPASGNPNTRNYVFIDGLES